MTTQIFTIDNFRKMIDALEKDGIVAFAVSSDYYGNAIAPSKQVPVYRIPCSIAGALFESTNLSLILNNARCIVALKEADVEKFSKSAREAYEKNRGKE